MLSLRWDNLIVCWAQTSHLMLAYIVKTTFKISKILFPQQSQIRDKTLRNTPWALAGNPFLFIKSYKALPFFLLSLWIMFFIISTPGNLRFYWRLDFKNWIISRVENILFSLCFQLHLYPMSCDTRISQPNWPPPHPAMSDPRPV